MCVCRARVSVCTRAFLPVCPSAHPPAHCRAWSCHWERKCSQLPMGYFHNGCLSRAGGRRVARGRVQRSSHSGWLSKLGLAQREAGSLELEPEPGLACPQGPQPHLLAHLRPAALPSDQVKGGSLNPSLPSASSLLPLSGWVWGGRSGWAQAPPSLGRLLKLMEREGERGVPAPSQSRPCRGTHHWPGCLLHLTGPLLPTVHLCFALLFFVLSLAGSP